MAYYRRIRDMREDHDLTQQKLAEYLDTKTGSSNTANAAAAVQPV